MQGDVVAILDADGNAKVEYTYDAWGKILSISGPMADTLGAVNPITYRGYVYDSDTDLYYLQSRYYDPAVGRFINSDVLASTGQDLIGHNMFAYCGNNPVNRADNGGYFWDFILDVCSLVVSVVEVIQNPTDVNAWIGLALDFVDVAVPVVGGLGEMADAFNAARKTVDAVDAFKAADNLGEVGEVIVKYGDEVKLPNQIKVNDAVDAWDDFLGPNQTSYNKFTGTNEMDRIFSADGTRSIRFCDHEMRSIGTTKAHFHYENWLFDPTSNTVYVENFLQRLK